MKLFFLFISFICLNGIPEQTASLKKKVADKRVKKEASVELFPNILFTHFN